MWYLFMEQSLPVSSPDASPSSLLSLQRVFLHTEVVHSTSVSYDGLWSRSILSQHLFTSVGFCKFSFSPSLTLNDCTRPQPTSSTESVRPALPHLSWWNSPGCNSEKQDLWKKQKTSHVGQHFNIHTGAAKWKYFLINLGRMLSVYVSFIIPELSRAPYGLCHLFFCHHCNLSRSLSATVVSLSVSLPGEC